MYKLEYSNRFDKYLDGIPKKDVEKILLKIVSLTKDPRPHGVETLSGDLKGYHRVRCGKYRIIYEICDGMLVILILRVSHRKDVYRK